MTKLVSKSEARGSKLEKSQVRTSSFYNRASLDASIDKERRNKIMYGLSAVKLVSKLEAWKTKLDWVAPYQGLMRVPVTNRGGDEMKTPIRSFMDLEVYQNTYAASLEVISKIVPKLPRAEQDDLADQLRRSAKAIPRLIAEGYSKKHQKKGFQKYLDDAMGESNEMIVSISHVRDLYSDCVESKLCENLIDLYDKSSRQLYILATKWRDFKER